MVLVHRLLVGFGVEGLFVAVVVVGEEDSDFEVGFEVVVVGNKIRWV